eukprot:jgi/Ulvmu1/1470/UM011_0200.1
MTASCDVDEISSAVHARLDSAKKPVTARWICYEHMCNMHTAQTLLHKVLSDGDRKFTVTHLIDGEFKDTGQRRVIMASSEKAKQLRDSMSAIISDQIYSISPAQGVADPTSLVSADVEQARVLMSDLMSSKASEQALAFAGNSSSMVRGTSCARKLGPLKAAAGGIGPPPRPKAQSAPPRSGAEKAKASGPVTSNPAPSAKAASVAAVAVKSEDGEKEPTAQTGAKAAAVPAAGKKRSALAASFGKAPPKQAKPKAEATVKVEPSEKAEVAAPAESPPGKVEPKQVRAKKAHQGKAPILDSEDDEDMEQSGSESPLASRPMRTTRQAAQLIDDDSDDDFAAPVKKKPAEPAVKKSSKPQEGNKPKQEAKQKSMVSGAEVAEKGQQGSDAVEPNEPQPAPAASEAQKPVAAEVMSDRSNGQAAQGREHPEYGSPPHPDAIIRMTGSKAFWEYIDDKGAEVSVIATTKAAKAAPVKQEKPQAKRPQPDTQNAGAAAEKPAKKKKPAGKHGKAAASAGDIRAMFGKKK